MYTVERNVIARDALDSDTPYIARELMLSGPQQLNLDLRDFETLRLTDVALQKCGDIEQSNLFWKLETSRLHFNQDNIVALIESSVEAGNFSIARQRLARVCSNLPEPIAWKLEYQSLLGCGEGKLSFEHIEKFKNLLPASAYTRFRINTLISEARYAEVLDLLSSQRSISSQEHFGVRIHSLVGLGEFRRAEAELYSMGPYLYDPRWVNTELARVASASRDYNLAVQRWESLFKSDRSSKPIVTGLFEALVSSGEFLKARSILEESEDLFTSGEFTRLQARLLQLSGEINNAVDLLRRSIDSLDGVASISTVGNLLSDLSGLYFIMYERTLAMSHLAEHLYCAERAVSLDPDNLNHKALHCNALIRNRAFTQAIAKIDALPDSQRASLLRLRMWKHSVENDFDAERQLWKRRNIIHYIPQIHAGKFSNLQRVDENSLTDGRQLTLYTCIKNERHRLPWFLNYYRSLGVENFVFVDNGSVDGSVDFLLKQTGTNIFQTQDSYHAAFAGMVWINYLRSLISKSGWDLYVDVDEALMFDQCERFSIHDLISQLEAEGSEAFLSFMLDMFSLSEIQGKDEDEIDFLKEYRDFLSIDIGECPKAVSPYLRIGGGLRSLFGTGEELTKTPLVRANRRISFLHSSHNISPARISKLRGVLLHYKIIDGLNDEADRVLEDQTRSMHCRLRYMRYRDVSSVQNLVEPYRRHVIRLEDSGSLVDSGLISSIDWNENAS